jgi:hypothetical protein
MYRKCTQANPDPHPTDRFPKQDQGKKRASAVGLHDMLLVTCPLLEAACAICCCAIFLVIHGKSHTKH